VANESQIAVKIWMYRKTASALGSNFSAWAWMSVTVWDAPTPSRTSCTSRLTERRQQFLACRQARSMPLASVTAAARASAAAFLVLTAASVLVMPSSENSNSTERRIRW
jgi:hypothetical protein